MRIDLVLAPNPGPLTGPGTNTWIVSSSGAAVVIDPGPVIGSHLDAVRHGLADLDTVGVLVTHAHPDHAPAANPLADALGVPVVGSAPGPGFRPDRLVADGDTVRFGMVEAVCVATPGHTPDSVSYRIGNRLFTGDHIMGGSTVVVEDMSDYMRSLQRLQATGLSVIHPGHGSVMDAPDRVIGEYLAHRIERERQIVIAVEGGAASLGEVVTQVYRDVDDSLHPVAAVSVGAHLRKLRDEGRVVCDAEPSWDSPVAPA